MNETAVICKRCGWRCAEPPAEPQWAELDEGRLVKLPPDMTSPHPPGMCNSPFVIGQKLYWNLDLADPDLPPLRVVFKELVEIKSAVFTLLNGDWMKESDARPSMCSIVVDMAAVFPEHVEIFGEDLLKRPIDVLIENLTPEEHWPLLEVA